MRHIQNTFGRFQPVGCLLRTREYICIDRYGEGHLIPEHIFNCRNKRKWYGRKTKDLTGQTFGWLKAKEITNLKQGKGCFWECKCRCGEMTIVSSTSLMSGAIKSCGCMGHASRMLSSFKNVTVDDISIELIQANQLRCKIEKRFKYGERKSA